MHPRCPFSVWETLARQLGLGLTADSSGRIYLSNEPLAYHPLKLREEPKRPVVTMLASWLSTPPEQE